MSKLTKNVSNGWVFSKKADFWLFYAPIFPFMLLGFYVMFSGTEITYFVRTGIFIEFFLTVFLDYPHAYSTFYRPFLADRSELSLRKFLFLGVPFLIYMAIFIGDQISTQGLLQIVTYLNVFHLIRQQWGWMSISDRKAGVYNKFNFTFDKIMLYIFTIGPLVWWHTQNLGSDTGFTSANDIPQILPETWGIYIHYFLAISFLIFVINHFYRWLSGQKYNFNKLFLILSTWFAWYIGIIWLRGEVVFIDVGHALPYIYLMFSYCKKVIQQNEEKKKGSTNMFQKEFFLKKYSWIIFLFYLLIIALISYENHTNYKNQWIEYLFLTMAVSHYIIDGFIWKVSKKENTSLMKNYLDIKFDSTKDKWAKFKDFFF